MNTCWANRSRGPDMAVGDRGGPGSPSYSQRPSWTQNSQHGGRIGSMMPHRMRSSFAVASASGPPFCSTETCGTICRQKSKGIVVRDEVEVDAVGGTGEGGSGGRRPTDEEGG